MSNSINILRATTMSQSNYKKTVAENKQQFYQDVVDDRFAYATDYMDILEENEVGSCIFQSIGARVTHAVNTSMTDTFANEFKKIIFQKYNHEQYLGKKYKFNGYTWLTTDLDTRTNASSHSFVRQCNNILKWYNPNNSAQLFSEPCVFTKQFTNTRFDEGSESVIQISGDFMVLCQANERTKTIPYNQRFVFNGLTFQITQFDNHRSDTYLILKLKQIEIQANDNITDNVANDTNGVPQTSSEIKILPQVIKILQGESENFTIYNYINGVSNSDAFTIIASQAPSSSFALTNITNNSFTITNIEQSDVPLIIQCTDTNTGEVITMNIVLGGVY